MGITASGTACDALGPMMGLGRLFPGVLRPWLRQRSSILEPRKRPGKALVLRKGLVGRLTPVAPANKGLALKRVGAPSPPRRMGASARGVGSLSCLTSPPTRPKEGNLGVASGLPRTSAPDGEVHRHRPRRDQPVRRPSRRLDVRGADRLVRRARRKGIPLSSTPSRVAPKRSSRVPT